MGVLQYYYTSFINQETGSAGFQVKAMSRDIRPDTQTLIARLMAYRIPPALNERAIDTHPVALRYYYLNAQECLLMHSQSNGNDPNGRPGNFFAHVLVTEPSQFTTIPPICYWKSHFWLKEDKQTRTELGELTDIPGDPELDIDVMWDFLRQKGHLEKFYKLMCAVVDGASSRRRIIIIDTDEHVALWVAAISCMLPPAYRPLLSFTTYHHDPYQSQFFITGTPKEAQFRLSPNDYEAYFVLNVHEDKVSEVKESLYAKLVLNFATPEKYDAEMLDFFSKYAQRFPNPEAIDDRLNLIAVYARIMREEGSVALSESGRQALLLVLPTFEQLKNYTAEDIDDIKHLGNFLWKTYEVSNDIVVRKIHQRVIGLQKQHQVPTEEVLKKQITHYTKLLFVGDVSQAWEQVRESIEQLYQEYREKNVFVNQVNESAYLKMLTGYALQAQSYQLTRVWQSIGPYLLPELPCLSLFAQSIQVYGTLKKNRQGSANLARDLFSAIHNAIQRQNQTEQWFKLLVSGIEQQSISVEPECLKLFYYMLVRYLSLQQREPYRTLILSIRPDTVETELLYDLQAAHLQDMLPILLKWVVYARDTQLYDPARLVTRGLPRLREQCNDNQWREKAQQCLIEAELRPFLGENETLLVKDAFTGVALDQFAPKYVPLYERYQEHPALPPQSKVVVSAMLAMQQRYFNAQLASELNQYLLALPLEKYEAEVRSVCDAFFTALPSDNEHFLLIAALFVWRYEERFWSIYWEKVTRQSSQALGQLMAFWFSLQPLKLSHRYVTQHFLLTLQDNVGSFRKFPDFEKVLSTLEGQPWYLAIRESNFVRKNAFQAMGQDLVKQLQKRLPNQKVDEEAEKEQRQFRAEMKELFAPGKIREMHLGTLMNIYNKRQPEQFWEAYKESLIQLLHASNVQLLIELFSFWFDGSSFETLGREPYIAQCFFIGLPQVFDLARKEHEANFRKMSQQIHSYTTQSKPPGWYPLVRKYLAEVDMAEKKSKWFGR